jgi:hypothetical protein
MPDAEEQSVPLAPGQQPAMQWLAPSTRKLARLAALIWLALLLWLAGLEWLVVAAPAPAALARRMGQLALPSAMFLAAPSLVIAPALGFLRGKWAFGFEVGLNLGLIGFIGTALAWAGVGAVYALDHVDPWEHMPWVTPPYLEAFIAAHPQIEVHKINGVRDVQITHRTDGGWMWVDGNLLAGSRARFERCVPPPTPAELGGLPIHFDATCQRVLTLTRPAGERVIYQFGLPPDGELDAIARHYTEWAASNQVQARFSGGTSRYEFRAEKGDREWDFWLTKRRGRQGALYVERGGRSLPWPEEDPP